jgi:hypothetical protein
MLAYLPKDKVAAEVMDVGGYVTVLRHALRWATANSVSGDQSAILDTTSYYHWQHLDATHFVIAQQVSSYKLYFAIPADATVYDVSVACFADNRVGNYQMVRLNGGVAVCEAPQAGLVTQPLSADKGGSVPNVVENWVGISYPLLNC